MCSRREQSRQPDEKEMTAEEKTGDSQRSFWMAGHQPNECGKEQSQTNAKTAEASQGESLCCTEQKERSCCAEWCWQGEKRGRQQKERKE